MLVLCSACQDPYLLKATDSVLCYLAGGVAPSCWCWNGSALYNTTIACFMECFLTEFRANQEKVLP